MQSGSYAFEKIAGIWALATLPMLLLARLVTPLLVPLIQAPPVLIYWLMLLLGMAWQTGLSLWLLNMEGLRWNSPELRQRLWLSPPRDPKTGQEKPRLFWRALPSLFAVLFVLGLGVLLVPNLNMLAMLLPFWRVPWWLSTPSYTYATELASAEFFNQWWLVIPALLTWLLSALIGEELLFRGVLLPKMSRLGGWDWVVNALLYALYHLFQPILIPLRLLDGLLVAGLARRLRSSWLAVILRSAEGLGLLFIVFLGIRSAPLPTLETKLTFPHIAARPEAMQLPVKGYAAQGSIPRYDPASAGSFQIDLRSEDLSTIDLSSAEAGLLHSDFDSRTRWPAQERMPAGFSPEQVMEIGKNPGLGIRALHAQGITGKGVGIAIIDQTLLVDHQEYAGRLRWYEEIGGSFLNPGASMHGPAVASIAVGKTVGVAPDADLYFFGTAQSPFSFYHLIAQGIRRVLEINERLPQNEQIRVISISAGWSPEMPGYYDAARAVQQASSAGVLVIYTNPGSLFGRSLMGLGRDPLADPDSFQSYGPGAFIQNQLFSGRSFTDTLWIPMDARTTAGPTGSSEYAHYSAGGLSWTVPYLAGVYALALQVDPALTPEAFIARAMDSGSTIQIMYEGKNYTLGPVIDPARIIASLK